MVLRILKKQLLLCRPVSVASGNSTPLHSLFFLSFLLLLPITKLPKKKKERRGGLFCSGLRGEGRKSGRERQVYNNKQRGEEKVFFFLLLLLLFFSFSTCSCRCQSEGGRQPFLSKPSPPSPSSLMQASVILPTVWPWRQGSHSFSLRPMRGGKEKREKKERKERSFNSVWRRRRRRRLRRKRKRSKERQRKEKISLMHLSGRGKKKIPLFAFNIPSVDDCLIFPLLSHLNMEVM